jgi:phosphohistidine phosphatase
MAVFLVQHGKSLPKEINAECPLSDEGRQIVEDIARTAAAYKLKVSLIHHSGKLRARETAEIMACFLKPAGGIHAVPGLNPLDDVTAAAHQLDSARNIMLVGHLPFLERLVSYLITGSPDRPVVKFQNGGIVCLDRQPDPEAWFIKWMLLPVIE